MANPTEITLRPDAKGRITLGNLAKGVSSFKLRQQENGNLVLEPYTEIPARERWVYENPKILASLERGIKDAAEGRVVSRGSFAKYLED